MKIVAEKLTELPYQIKVIDSINESKTMSKLIGQMNHKPSIIN